MIINFLFIILSLFSTQPHNIENNNNAQINLSTSDAENYILNRSFGIGCFNSNTGYGVVGTCWLYKHISSYTYECITNWHVVDGFTKVESPKYGVCHKDGNRLPLSYYQVDYKLLADGDWGKTIDNNCIDAAICQVTFHTNTFSFLNDINTYADNHNGIVSPIINANIISQSSDLYYGGYPASNIQGNRYVNGQQWAFSDTIHIGDQNTQYVPGNVPSAWNNKNSPYIHYVNDEQTIIANGDDIAFPAFVPSDTQDISLFGGGCSGSMIITQNSDGNDFVIVGLIWGAYVNMPPNNSYFQTVGTKLWTNNYNFYDAYSKGDLVVPKEKNNNTLVIIFCACGIVLIIVGFIILCNHKNKNSKKS